MNQPKRDFRVQPLPGCPAEIGALLWMLEDTRAETLKTLKNVPAGGVDAPPPVGANTIGVLLYHIAGVEASWLYEDTLEMPDLPEDVLALFPHDMRDEAGMLVNVRGMSLESHLERLAAVRARLLDVYTAMSLDDFRRSRTLPDYNATPEWILHHLIQHEAEHRGHIQTIIEGLAAHR